MGRQARTASREVRQARAAAARRARKRNRILSAAGGVVIVGLVVAIVVALVNAAGDRPDPAAVAADVVAPAGATAAGAIPIGAATAPVTVDVYLDYMCPFCGRFERANGAEIDRLVAEGTVRLNLHPLAFLDRASAGTRYSTRAANAVATVADAAPGTILAFTTALFADQPEEGGPGLSDEQIATLARQAGVTGDVVDRFAARAFQPWIAASTETTMTQITGTPTVKINGKLFTGDLYTAGPLTQAITAAKAR